MDEYKIIFWIIIALIYLFSRRKKKQQEQAPPRRQPSQSPAQTTEYEEAPPKKQLTFEELLREIEEMKQPAAPQPPPNPYRPPVRKEPEYVDYDDELKEEKEAVEDTDYDYRKADKIYDVYEDAKKQAFLRPSLEETVKLQDTVVRFNQFKEYEQRERRNLAGEFLKEFKDPSGFRKAFIMSEILRRKF